VGARLPEPEPGGRDATTRKAPGRPGLTGRALWPHNADMAHPRAQEILAAIVQEYMNTGEAVGSRALVAGHHIKASASTVRNVMGALENEGLLHQPHTSAGRVPTDLGLRYYVDQLMHVQDLERVTREEIMRRYDLTGVEVQHLMREVSHLLSDISRHCSMVVVPRSNALVLSRLEFIPLRPGRLIAVLVMGSGVVQNRVLRVEDDLSSEDLEAVHRYINALCDGRPLADVRRCVEAELQTEQTRYNRQASRALSLGAQALDSPEEDEVLVEGRARLLDHPGAMDRDTLREILDAVEQKRRVLELLDKTMDAQGVRIFIGAETGDEAMSSLSLVASSYGGDRPLGTLGVLGPSNMAYPKVVPLVDFTAHVLTRVLSDQ